MVVNVVFHLTLRHNKSSCAKTDKSRSQNKGISENNIRMSKHKNKHNKINSIYHIFVILNHVFHSFGEE